MSTGKNDERMGVEVFALILRRAVRVDTVEPAPVLGVMKVLLQRAKQRGCPLGRAREGRVTDQAGEHIQLAGAGHGAVTLRR